MKSTSYPAVSNALLLISDMSLFLVNTSGLSGCFYLNELNLNKIISTYLCNVIRTHYVAQFHQCWNDYWIWFLFCGFLWYNFVGYQYQSHTCQKSLNLYFHLLFECIRAQMSTMTFWNNQILSCWFSDQLFLLSPMGKSER